MPSIFHFVQNVSGFRADILQSRAVDENSENGSSVNYESAVSESAITMMKFDRLTPFWTYAHVGQKKKKGKEKQQNTL